MLMHVCDLLQEHVFTNNTNQHDLFFTPPAMAGPYQAIKEADQT